MAPNNGELKNFYLKANVCKESIKTVISEDHKLTIKFKVNSSVDSYVRVNACVTEKKNANNVPEM